MKFVHESRCGYNYVKYQWLKNSSIRADKRRKKPIQENKNNVGTVQVINKLM